MLYITIYFLIGFLYMLITETLWPLEKQVERYYKNNPDLPDLTDSMLKWSIWITLLTIVIFWPIYLVMEIIDIIRAIFGV